jgi:HAD superfamily hydrolase (TIGR01549 family)
MARQSKTKEQGSVSQNGNSRGPSLLFDLDGTLADSVYEHVIASEAAFQKRKFNVEAWKIHRYIGISGKLLVRGVFRDARRVASDSEVEKLEQLHKKACEKMLHGICPLPGSRELLSTLTKKRIRWAIASNGDEKAVNFMKRKLGVPQGVPVITGTHVEKAKPEPDVFLAAAEQLDVPLRDSIVVGDSVWDLLAARRARALAVGLLSGGYSRQELERAGAYRVCANPAECSNILKKSEFRHNSF